MPTWSATRCEQLDLPEQSLLMIENVGNLVCPAAFDLGEAHKVVILSVTEGEDKPLKYPDMFRAADLMLLNKMRPAAPSQLRCGAGHRYARARQSGHRGDPRCRRPRARAWPTGWSGLRQRTRAART